MLGSVLITGGSGSFGKAFTRRLLADKLSDRIRIFSRGEHAQESMARELASLDPAGNRIRYLVGDIRDANRLAMALRGVDTVIHAAAMKVVPKCEYDPFEAVKTNILGAQNVIEAALSAGVGKVVALSTDKCVSPANLYGATKLCAEKLFTAADVYAGGRDTRFSVVRYGNIAGSQGSVIPLWRSLLAGSNRKIVPVTSPFCTRYYMTLDEAVQLVFWTLSNMRGGETVIPEMAAYQLSDLAEAMEAKQEIVGLRPGEKLHEAIVSEHEMHQFRLVGEYWVSGVDANNIGTNMLGKPLVSNEARRLSVAEIRECLSEQHLLPVRVAA